MSFSLGAWTKNKVAPFTVGLGGQASIQPPTISYHFELADQAAMMNPPGQTPAGISYVRAVIRQKSFTPGNGTIGPIYEVQTAADVGFTSQVRDVAVVTALRSTTDQTYLLEGVVPDDQSTAFVRVKLTLSGTDAAVYDALLDMIP